VGVENNTDWNFKDLEGMLGSAKTLKRNNRECKGILIGPLMAPRFFESVKFLGRGFFTHCPSQHVGFGPKSCGTDGKPTNVRGAKGWVGLTANTTRHITCD
jgi:hypothetical protein